MSHCDIIFAHTSDDEYILQTLSAWKIEENPREAARRLRAVAIRYADLPDLAQACAREAASLSP